MNAPLIHFLQESLELPTDSIQFAVNHSEPGSDLPMILWQYGLISLPQLERIWDWMFTSPRQAPDF